MRLRLSISPYTEDQFKFVWGTDTDAVKPYFVSRKLVEDASSRSVYQSALVYRLRRLER